MEPTTITRPESGGGRRSRLEGWLVLLAFLGPLAVAVGWYALRDALPVPEPRTEGTLIHPARPIESFSAVDAAGAAVGVDFFRGRWSLVYVAGPDCDLRCQALLFKTRQLRLSLGRDLPRVQWVVLSGPQWSVPPSGGVDPPVLRAAALPAAFGPEAQGRLFVVDPHGNVMMRYGPDADIRGMQRDLKRLLKVSKIG
jgi:hypothetical protein